MNFRALKSQAKESIRLATPSPKMIALQYWGIILLCIIPYEAVSYYLQHMAVKQTGIAAIAARANTNLTWTCLYILVQLVTMVMSVGFENYGLALSRNKPANLSTILYAFTQFFRVIILLFLMYIRVVLWSFLFVIPGIVASYRYRFAVLALLDNPELTPTQAINRSTRLTYGHKMEIFTLDLTMFWYYLLSNIGPCLLYLHAYNLLPLANTDQVHYTLLAISYCITILTDVNFLPYVHTTYANCYRKLHHQYFGDETPQ